MKFRKATINDTQLLVNLRKQQLINEHLPSEPNIDDELHQFFNTQLTSPNFAQWLLETDDGHVMATGAIIFYPFPPSQYNPPGIRGYIANMYTIKQYRGNGYAKLILNHLLDEAKARKVHKLFLYASDMGKPVYKAYGFKEVDAYMEFTIE